MEFMENILDAYIIWLLIAEKGNIYKEQQIKKC